MDETIKAYLAGIVDGEGSISIVRNFSKGSRHRNICYTLCVQITMLEKEAINLLTQSFDGHVCLIPPRNNPNRWSIESKAIWQWGITNDKAKQMLIELRPHLRVKLKQALLAIKFREEWQSQANRGCKGSDPKVIKQREQMALQMRLLNHRCHNPIAGHHKEEDK